MSWGGLRRASGIGFVSNGAERIFTNCVRYFAHGFRGLGGGSRLLLHWCRPIRPHPTLASAHSASLPPSLPGVGPYRPPGHLAGRFGTTQRRARAERDDAEERGSRSPTRPRRRLIRPSRALDRAFRDDAKRVRGRKGRPYEGRGRKRTTPGAGGAPRSSLPHHVHDRPASRPTPRTSALHHRDSPQR